MGTRSCIIVKVRKADSGKTVKFDKKSLPVPLNDWVNKDEKGVIWRNEKGKERSKPIELTGEYVGVYCHWDGYPDGVGKVLKELFNDYDSALNLVSGGNLSSVWFDYVRHYANRCKKGDMCYETWEQIMPKQGKRPREVFQHFGWIEYVYLFDEEKGGWVYKSNPDTNASFRKY